MFRFFENLVDPFVGYKEVDVPPQNLWSFLWEYSQPFKRLYAISGLMSVIVAGVEIWMLWYLGRLVDILTEATPSEVWDRYGNELILVAIFVLLMRPALQAFDVLLLNNALLPNFGTLIRWRAHKHVLRQSVGWFENDFAGRIANRIMQTPPAAGEAVFHVFDAITFAFAYLIGAALLLLDADPRLLLPLAGWFVLYSILVRWTVVRVGPASQAASDARSEVTGRVVDAYSNIHSVKMFAHHDKELTYAKEAIEKTKSTFSAEMRIYTLMDVVLVLLNGVLIVGVVGWAIALWMNGSASVGIVAAATALTLRLNAMTGWIMWALTTFFRSLGIVAEGMETIAQPINLVDRIGAKPLELRNAQIDLIKLTHHYGRPSGGLEAVDLSIMPGEKIGLVGKSGAGKSTLVKLLLRFYDPESGRIEIDGQDIGGVQQDSLRSVIGMVQQDNSLLHRSVRDNIAYGRPDATEAEIIQASKRAEAHDFILELQDPKGRIGYDAQVG